MALAEAGAAMVETNAPPDWKVALDLREDEVRQMRDDGIDVPDCIAPPSRKAAFENGISAAALMTKEFPPIRYVVEGILAEGLTLLAGAPKLGKSWMALGLGVAVALNVKAFGSVSVDAGDVLYLALEDNQRRLQNRLLMMGYEVAPQRLTLCTEWPTLADGAIDEIKAWIAAVEKPTLLIVDVLAKVRDASGSKDSAYDADYRTLTGLQELAGREGLAVVAVHHTRKMESDDPFDAVSGTRGLTGAADSVLVLKKEHSSGRTVLYGRGRDLPEFETAFELDGDKGMWSVLGAAYEVGRTNERHEIIQTLQNSDDPLSPKEVSDILGKNANAIRQTMTRMAHSDEIQKVSRGLYACHNGHNVTTPSADRHSDCDTPNNSSHIQCAESDTCDSPVTTENAKSPRESDKVTDVTGLDVSQDDEGWIGESPSQTKARLSRRNQRN